MKLIHKHLVAAAMLAALGATAVAQTAPATTAPAAEARHGKYDPAKRMERFSKRMGELKQKLQITPAQEAGWTSFTTAMQPSGAYRRIDRDAVAKLSTPDRIDQMRALRNQRIAEMDRRGDATKAFYNTLTAEQRQVFDTETAKRGGHRGHHGHRGMRS